jgi:hypothetical protein
MVEVRACGRDLRSSRLKQHANNSLGWLTRNLNEFSPTGNGRLKDLRVKALSELSLVFALLCQWRHLRASRPLKVWRTFILQHCENPEYAQMPRKRPLAAFLYLMPYFMLRSTGYRWQYYEEVLSELQRQRLFELPEVVPYRALDRAYTLWKSGFLLREPRWLSLYRGTTLDRCRGPLHLDDEAAYSITHTLFYLTDFGNRTATLPEVEIRRAADVVECLLLHYWRMGHWDLVGELLIGLNCLGVCRPQIYLAAAEAFLGAWWNSGAVPAKAAFKEEQYTLGRPGKLGRTFQACYHTTLVGVLYCTTAINRIYGTSEALRI